MIRLLVRLLLLCLLVPSLAFAQAAPTSAQRAVSGLVQGKMAQRGFASNDPQWSTTLGRAGAQIAGAAAGAAAITAAGLTAPAWVTAAAAVALGAAITYGIGLAYDGTVQWLANADGSVTRPGGGSATAPLSGQLAWTGNNGYYGAIWSSNPNEIIDYQMKAQGGTSFDECQTIEGGGRYNCTWYINGNWQGGVDAFKRQMDVNTANAASGCAGVFAGGECLASTLPPTQGGSSTMSPTQAAASLTPAEKAKPANPQLIASIADNAWKTAAAQPGYAGAPYDPANPITTADATAWQQANPTLWPTVGQLVEPQAGTSAFSLPNSAATPAVTPEQNPAGTSTPAITSPTLDWAIPNSGETISKIEVPASYTPTIFAAPTGCPAPVTFEMFGRQYFISYQPACDLMSMLAPIFLACGAMAAAMIFAESLKS